MAGMFVALIARCLATAGRAAARKRLVACAAAALPPLATIVGFTLTRTSGLPQAIDDVGDWTEALGLASPLVEGAVAALAGGVLEPATPANDSS